MRKSLIDILLCVPVMTYSYYMTNYGFPFWIQFMLCCTISLYLILIPPHRSVILFCSLGVFSSTHHLFISGLNCDNEPYYFKAIKDVILFGLVLNLLFKNKERKNYCYKNLFSNLWTLIAFMILVFIHIIILSLTGDLFKTFVSIRYLIVYPIIAFLSVGVFRQIDYIENFFKILSILGLIVCCIGFVEVLSAYKTYYYGYIDLGFIHQRMISTLQNPNNCALFLLVPVIFLFVCLINKFGSTFLNVSLLVILTIGIFLTFSRSAFAIFYVGIIYLSIYYKSVRALSLCYISGMIGLVLILSTTLSRTSMQNATTADVNSSLLDRLLYGFIYSIKNFWDTGGGLKLITGIGFGSSESVITDNMYTHVLLRGGIISLLFFVICLIVILQQSISIIRISSGKTRMIVSTISAIVLMIIVHMFSALTIQLFPVCFLFWIFVSYIWSIKYEKNGSD